MPVVASDILIKLSVAGAASAGDATAQADPNASLGKYMATTQLVDNTSDNLFDDVSGNNSAAGITQYRCLFVHNSHATATMTGTKVWLQSEVALGGVISIGVDGTATSAHGATGVQAVNPANETTAPSGVTFTSGTNEAGAISLGDLAPGQVRAFWVRRVVSASTAALANDGVTFRVKCDTV